MSFIAHSHVTDVHILVAAAVSTKGRSRGRGAWQHFIMYFNMAKIVITDNTAAYFPISLKFGTLVHY